MQQTVANTSLERVLSCPNLPTLPVVAMRVLELTAKPDVSLREIAAVIENDPAIAAKVLRTVNSSYYALSRRCGSIQQALAFLGLQTVKALVLGFSLARSIDGGGDDEVSFDFLDYWRRSLYAAAAAREIATLGRHCDPDEAFVAALVQDIGMVAMWRAYGDRYLQVVDLARGEHRRLAALEQRSLEIDHTTIGAEMLSRWRFPEAVVSAVRCHHRSHEAEPSAVLLARTVEFAGTAAAVLSIRQPQSELTRFRREGQEWFDFRNGPMTLLLQRVADRADELSRAFGLDTGSTADVDAILRKASDIRRDQGLVEPSIETSVCDITTPLCESASQLPDAHALGSEIEAAFHAVSSQGGIGLLLVGIDHARCVQDAYGARGTEAAMDHVLAAVRHASGSRSRAFRFVGAEIAVLLRDADSDELCRIAEHIRRSVAERTVTLETATDGGFPITVSIGAAMYEADETVRQENCIGSPDQLVSASMFALASGRRSRNRVVIFRKSS
jgi:diguanylate cyclase (GGDEF)-like protein